MRKMRFSLKNVAAIVACFAVCLAFTACDKDDEKPVEGNEISMPNTGEAAQTAYADEETTGNGFTFTAKSNWTATVTETTLKSSNVPWISLLLNGVETYRGDAGTFRLVISIEPNYSGVKRSAKIEIVCGSDKISISVEQEGTTQEGEVPVEPPIIGDEKELTNAMINQSNATLQAGLYLAKSNLTLNSGNVLTIAPGVVIHFSKDVQFTVEGKAMVKANGTASRPITFTSGSNQQPGDWRCILINDSPGSEFEWCVFEYGSGSNSWSNTGLLNIRKCLVSVKNCTFREAQHSGIYIDDSQGGFSVFDNNTITNCGENENGAYPLKAEGGILTLAGIGTGNVITSGDMAVETKGIGIYGGTVTSNMTLQSFIPYTIYSGDIAINDNSVLTLEAGTVLKFGVGRAIEVRKGGKLIANGTVNNKITFTSSNANKNPGDWYGVRIMGDGLGSEFEHCLFEYGSGSDSWSTTGFLNIRSGAKTSVKNCTFTEAKYSGIYLETGTSGFTAFEYNTIENCGETQNNHYPIKADGGVMNLAGIGAGNYIPTVKGIGVYGGTVTSNMTLQSFVHYIIYSGDIAINDNAVLTLEAGTVLKFGISRAIEVKKGGKLMAIGNANNKITFTSSNANKNPGDWYGVRIMSDGIGSEFEHCLFEYGSGSDSWSTTGFLNIRSGAKTSVKNCTFTEAKYSGIYLETNSSGFTAFENNTIENCGEDQNNHYPIKADGGIMTLEGMMYSENIIITDKGIGIYGGTVNKDMKLKKYPYIIYSGDISVTSNTTEAILTIDPGAVLKFGSNRSLTVNTGGRLIAQGTANEKIYFIGMVADKGYWYGIHFRGNSVLSGNILNNCVVSHGGYGSNWTSKGNISCVETLTDRITIQNCQITMSLRNGIFLYRAGTVSMSGNTFADIDGENIGVEN